MPATRFIRYDNHEWRLSQLARRYHLAPGTLSRRLDRFGETATGIARALATGILTREQSGRRGALKSPWRYEANR
ncbi:MAG: hypothetical protein KDJ31_19990 [Candidatus Competibacteraceae bacterium]|nr:hypothetical protein [Candidatus Competibacteraceae bacterium]